MSTDNLLIIFSRYPEPGKTKTRMIPALGAEGAAQLQREMTEYTLKQAKSVQSTQDLTLEVHFAGGNQKLMQTWLGEDVTCKAQSLGDLGNRMIVAFANAFADGKKAVVIIGIDCPGVNSQILTPAFAHLQQHNLVLGEAADGGYYLIGLRHPVPELLTGIDWGSEQVFSQTVAIAQQLNLATAYLPILQDVDRPEDLPVWLRLNDT